MFIASRDETYKQIEDAKKFYEQVRKYVMKKYSGTE